MDNETAEVITPEIVPTDGSDSNNTNPAAHLAVLGLAAVGAVKVANVVRSKVAFRSPIVRRSKVVETPVAPAPPVDAPVAAE